MATDYFSLAGSFIRSFPLAADMLPPKPKVHYGIPVGHNGIRPAHVDAQYLAG
jgi:hypothetical protein